MKKITYDYLSSEYIDEENQVNQVFINKEMLVSDEDFAEVLLHVIDEAYDGKYVVEDIENPPVEPTKIEILESQIAYLAMMTNNEEILEVI